MQVSVTGVLQRAVPSRDGQRVYVDLTGLKGDGQFSLAFEGVTLDEIRKVENQLVAITGDVRGRTYKGANNLSFFPGKFQIKLLPPIQA